MLCCIHSQLLTLQFPENQTGLLVNLIMDLISEVNSEELEHTKRVSR